MPFRIREILLVSSAYDAFVLEEDGSLTDRLFYEYSELSLSWAPRITHARSGRRALELLGERRFDLVLTVVRVGDVDAGELSRLVRERVPDITIALLTFDEHDLAHFPNARVPSTIDRVFQWTGDASVFIAAIKSIEDQRNADHDCAAAGVQVILVVEDRVRSYSSFLALLYPELLAQSGSLIGEGLNDLHRLMRMRARPKIVLATTFDEGVQLFERYRPYICAVMSDIRMPHGGEMDPRGGFALAERIRAERSDLPILFQSAEPDGERPARAIGAWFLNKNAPDFPDQVRWFLQEALGFGDFVFRLPDRTEVARARDVYEMEQALRSVPRESVAFHAAHNHFSVWLRARCLFPLADLVRPRRLADFADVEELRTDLLRILHEARLNEQEGVITDLAARHTGPENRFVRVGRGSVGGKGRAVAFVSAQIVRHGLLQRYKDLQIRVPKTVVLGTDAFETFMDRVDRAGLTSLTDEGVTERMLAASLPDEVMRDLHKAWINLKGPLAVRSSSLLEDSRFQPFAG
ncbi:MAG TPA: PEP/pyruvate-binding domain-containing protein, partial [Polyangiaceae bacterium]|nr:PEP/pyruvate-binding domain-containing protein [Polyangiaceae bacterium]